MLCGPPNFINSVCESRKYQRMITTITLTMSVLRIQPFHKWPSQPASYLLPAAIWGNTKNRSKCFGATRNIVSGAFNFFYNKESLTHSLTHTHTHTYTHTHAHAHSDTNMIGIWWHWSAWTFKLLAEKGKYLMNYPSVW